MLGTNGMRQSIFAKPFVVLQRCSPADPADPCLPKSALGARYRCAFWMARANARPLFSSTLQFMRLYFQSHYFREADFTTSAKSPKQKLSRSRQYDPFAKAFPMRPTAQATTASTLIALSFAGAICRALAGSLARIICDLIWPVKALAWRPTGGHKRACAARKPRGSKHL